MEENILIIDTETTGLSPSENDVIEIAAILFNVKHKSVLQCFSTLLPCDTNKAIHINKIKPEATIANFPFIKALDEKEPINICIDPNGRGITLYSETLHFNRILFEMVDAAQLIVAHNAQFDKKFIEKLSCGRYLLNKKWICTKNDFKWPVPLERKRLEDVCTAMGVVYTYAHRALEDCLLLAKCFEKIIDLHERF